MKKTIKFACLFTALLTLSACSSKKDDKVLGTITIYNSDYNVSVTKVSEIPSGYEYIGELPEKAANDTGLGGCKMYAVKELNSLTEFYLYQECENNSDNNKAFSEQPKGSYFHCTLCE